FAALLFCSFARSCANRYLHSFPTRRSSDLELLELDCRVSIIPYATATETLDSLQLDGLLFSNGPGDPAALQHLFPTYRDWAERRSEEHTSELQSRENLVCRLLLEKKKTNIT